MEENSTGRPAPEKEQAILDAIQLRLWAGRDVSWRSVDAIADETGLSFDDVYEVVDEIAGETSLGLDDIGKVIASMESLRS